MIDPLPQILAPPGPHPWEPVLDVVLLGSYVIWRFCLIAGAELT